MDSGKSIILYSEVMISVNVLKARSIFLPEIIPALRTISGPFMSPSVARSENVQ